LNKRLRPIPYPVGSPARSRYVAFLRRYGALGRPIGQVQGLTYQAALKIVSEANLRTRNLPSPGERCEARTRRGTACQCKALPNGRCKLHGGMSTGPRTAAGKAAALANLRIKRKGT
jgi:hypothetical protein